MGENLIEMVFLFFPPLPAPLFPPFLRKSFYTGSNPLMVTGRTFESMTRSPESIRLCRFMEVCWKPSIGDVVRCGNWPPLVGPCGGFKLPKMNIYSRSLVMFTGWSQCRPQLIMFLESCAWESSHHGAQRLVFPVRVSNAHVFYK